MWQCTGIRTNIYSVLRPKTCKFRRVIKKHNKFLTHQIFFVQSNFFRVSRDSDRYNVRISGSENPHSWQEVRLMKDTPCTLRDYLRFGWHPRSGNEIYSEEVSLLISQPTSRLQLGSQAVTARYKQLNQHSPFVLWEYFRSGSEQETEHCRRAQIQKYININCVRLSCSRVKVFLFMAAKPTTHDEELARSLQNRPISHTSLYKVVQIWLGQTVTCLHTNSPGHIWTTLYIQASGVSLYRYSLHFSQVAMNFVHYHSKWLWYTCSNLTIKLRHIHK